MAFTSIKRLEAPVRSRRFHHGGRSYASLRERGRYRSDGALNMPDTNLGDTGDNLGQWTALISPLLSSLITVGGQFATAKISSAAITKQIQMQTQAQVETAKAQAAQIQAQRVQTMQAGEGGIVSRVTSSPYLIPIVAVVGLGALFLFIRRK
jgi:hypothetical protein